MAGIDGRLTTTIKTLLGVALDRRIPPQTRQKSHDAILIHAERAGLPPTVTREMLGIVGARLSADESIAAHLQHQLEQANAEVSRLSGLLSSHSAAPVVDVAQLRIDLANANQALETANRRIAPLEGEAALVGPLRSRIIELEEVRLVFEKLGRDLPVFMANHGIIGAPADLHGTVSLVLGHLAQRIRDGEIALQRSEAARQQAEADRAAALAAAPQTASVARQVPVKGFVGAAAGQITRLMQAAISGNILAAIKRQSTMLSAFGGCIDRPAITARFAKFIRQPELAGKPGSLLRINIPDGVTLVFIGDLHGDLQSWNGIKAKYEQGLKDKTHILLFAGDLIHSENPANYEETVPSKVVTDEILELIAKYPESVWNLRGNHDTVDPEIAAGFTKGGAYQGLLHVADLAKSRGGEYGDTLEEFFEWSPRLASIYANGKPLGLAGHAPVSEGGITEDDAVNIRFNAIHANQLAWARPDANPGNSYNYGVVEAKHMLKKFGFDPEKTYLFGGHTKNPDETTSAFFPYPAEMPRHILMQACLPGDLQVIEISGTNGDVNLVDVARAALTSSQTGRINPLAPTAVAAPGPSQPRVVVGGAARTAQLHIKAPKRSTYTSRLTSFILGTFLAEFICFDSSLSEKTKKKLYDALKPAAKDKKKPFTIHIANNLVGAAGEAIEQYIDPLAHVIENYKRRGISFTKDVYITLVRDNDGKFFLSPNFDKVPDELGKYFE